MSEMDQLIFFNGYEPAGRAGLKIEQHQLFMFLNIKKAWHIVKIEYLSIDGLKKST